MITFTNILGYKCVTTSEHTICYGQDVIAEIINDPISHTPINHAIILCDQPYNIYDKDTLLEWFTRSNKEPCLGIEMNDLAKYSKYMPLCVIAMLLENAGDCYIFHRPRTHIFNLYQLVKHIMNSNGTYTTKIEDRDKFVRRTWEKNIAKLPFDKITEEKLIYLDESFYVYDDNKPFPELYYDYDIQTILLQDMITKKYQLVYY